MQNPRRSTYPIRSVVQTPTIYMSTTVADDSAARSTHLQGYAGRDISEADEELKYCSRCANVRAPQCKMRPIEVA